VLVHEKRFEEIAEVISLITSDNAFRDRIVAAQRQRLTAFQRPAIEQRLRDVLADWL
jgi:hypothetical protein